MVLSYLRYLCLFAYSGVQHILCRVFVLFFSVLCTLCCQFLWIFHFWLPLWYSPTFICTNSFLQKPKLKEFGMCTFCKVVAETTDIIYGDAAELQILGVALTYIGLPSIILIDWLIDWCLKPILAVFQIYRVDFKFRNRDLWINQWYCNIIIWKNKVILLALIILLNWSVGVCLRVAFLNDTLA